MTHTAEIELDEFALPTADVTFGVDYVPADPDVGIFSGYYVFRARVTGWNVGNLRLNRYALVKAIGDEAVCKIEWREAEKYAAELDAGNGSDCDDRFDVARDDAQ